MNIFLMCLFVSLLVTQLHYIIKFLNTVTGRGLGDFGLLMYSFLNNIGLVFRLLNTLVHEIGHVLMSFITRGEVYKVSLFKDGGGLAVTGSSSWLSRVLTSFAGYPFASLFSLMLVYLLSIDKHYLIVYILVGLVLGALILFVRNFYGFVWSIMFLIILLLVDTYASLEFLNIFLMLVVSVLVIESLVSCVYIFYLSVYRSRDSGDAGNLSKYTKLPSFLFGMFFLVQSGVIFYYSLNLIM